MRLIKTKKFLFVLVAVIAIAVAASAYAYYSSTGSGTGSATAGSSSGIVLSGSPTAALYPGGADAPVTVHLSNPGGGNEYVGTISGTVEDKTTTAGTCHGSWFTVDDITYDASLAAGASDTASTNMRMTDSGGNQDACQGATLTIDWSSN